MSRAGSVLIVVSGMAVLVLGLGLAFLVRMRVEAEENQALVRDLQARVMLMAGCDYVLECARIGYDPQPEVVGGANPRSHAEAFGWIDVRPKFNAPPDVGPRDASGAQLWDDTPLTAPGQHPRWRWPRIGSAARCPMHVMRRPPYATATIASYNPMATDPTDPLFGQPALRWPDPQPPIEVSNGWPANPTDPVTAAAAVNGTSYGAYRVQASPATFAGGDLRPRPETTSLSWFRVFRESSAGFVVTCGAGGSLGFRDWDDVQFENATDQFENDRQRFEQILAEETRLWYRIEWSDATGAIYLGGFIDNEIYPSTRTWDLWLLHPVNSMQRTAHNSHRNDIFRPNHCGTIRWVQRLDSAPPPPASDPGAISW